MSPTEVPAVPLARLQGVRADKAGTLKVLEAVNAALPDAARLDLPQLQETFESFWEKLAADLDAIPDTEQAPKVPTEAERHQEVVGLLTNILGRIQITERRAIASEKVERALRDASARPGGPAYGGVGYGGVFGSIFDDAREHVADRSLADVFADAPIKEPTSDKTKK